MCSQSSEDEEEKARFAAEKEAKEKAAQSNGALSTGTHTPTGRKEKHGGSSDVEGIKKSSSSTSLKRPGSPNISDASGTDTSTTRKKKKSRHVSSSQPTPVPSRPLSPANVPSSAPNTKKKRKSMALGAGSDTEAAAMSDGAMSDASRAQKRQKLSATNGGPPISISRPSSPPPQPKSFPTAEEVIQAIPPAGLTTKELLRLFSTRITDRKTEFISLIRDNTTFNRETKTFTVKSGSG